MNQTLPRLTSSKKSKFLQAGHWVVTCAVMAASLLGSLTTAKTCEVPRERRSQSVVQIDCSTYKSATISRNSRARRDVGTIRLNGRSSPKVSGQVLADVASHLQHVDARHREDRL